VKFLGEVPDGIVHDVDERISGLKISEFDAVSEGIGVFPDLQSPRIVWTGVDEKSQEPITKAATSIIVAMKGIGKPDERPFQAHVTVGRVRSPRNLPKLAALVRENKMKHFGTTRISSLKLKSSTLTPRGPIYQDIKEYAIG
jgi:RNA 2',3'-cyclic 3'-phosphodiesterase